MLRANNLKRIFSDIEDIRNGVGNASGNTLPFNNLFASGNIRSEMKVFSDMGVTSQGNVTCESSMSANTALCTGNALAGGFVYAALGVIAQGNVTGNSLMANGIHSTGEVIADSNVSSSSYLKGTQMITSAFQEAVPSQGIMVSGPLGLNTPAAGNLLQVGTSLGVGLNQYSLAVSGNALVTSDLVSYGNITGGMGNVTEASAGQGILVTGNIGLAGSSTSTLLRLGTDVAANVTGQVPFDGSGVVALGGVTAGSQSVFINYDGEMQSMTFGLYSSTGGVNGRLQLYQGRGTGGTLLFDKQNVALGANFLVTPLVLTFNPGELYLIAGEYTLLVTKQAGTGDLVIGGVTSPSGAGAYQGVINWTTTSMWMSFRYTQKITQGLSAFSSGCNFGGTFSVTGNATCARLKVSRIDQLVATANAGPGVVLPSNVAGYLPVTVAGTLYKIPLFQQ